MLPFLQPKNIASIISETRKKDGTKSVEPLGHSEELIKIAEHLIASVHAKDAKAVAQSLDDAFDHLEETEPDEDNQE
jgi:hypothetical protein